VSNASYQFETADGVRLKKGHEVYVLHHWCGALSLSKAYVQEVYPNDEMVRVVFRPKGIESANLYHNKVYHDVKRAAEEFVRIFSFDPIEAKKTMLTPVKEER